MVNHAPPAPSGQSMIDTWPWNTQTGVQGFLSNRWIRRDGDIYASGALRGLPGPNSPIAGGDDANAKVDVPSGVPRVNDGPSQHPAGNIRPSGKR